MLGGSRRLEALRVVLFEKHVNPMLVVFFLGDPVCILGWSARLYLCFSVCSSDFRLVTLTSGARQPKTSHCKFDPEFLFLRASAVKAS